MHSTKNYNSPAFAKIERDLSQLLESGTILGTNRGMARILNVNAVSLCLLTEHLVSKGRLFSGHIGPLKWFSLSPEGKPLPDSSGLLRAERMAL